MLLRPVIFYGYAGLGAGWDELSKRGGKRNSKRDGRQGSKRDGRRGSKRGAYIQNYQHIAEKSKKAGIYGKVCYILTSMCVLCNDYLEGLCLWGAERFGEVKFGRRR